MVTKGQDRKTVFILGAGASRGALRHVVLNGKRIKPPLNSDFFRVADTYAKAKGSASADARRLARLKKIFKDNIPIKGVPTMEEAFSLLYVTKDFPEIYRTGPGRRPAADSRREIEDFLRLTFGILVLLDQDSVTETGYDRLAEGLGQADTVISLNYDTLLDSALTRRGWDPRTGYSLGGGERKVEWESPNSRVNSRAKDTKLLKLHGSVNWYVRGSVINLSKVFASKPALVRGPRRNEVKGYIRQIIPPVFGKIFEHDHWRNLWRRAFQALCDADALVVVGCSLVDTDFHLRALLSRAVKHRKKKKCPFKRLIVADRVRVRRKWEEVLKGCYRRAIRYPTFNEFLSQELKS